MTEAEWLESTNPAEMLTYLLRHVSDRKLRLYSCACCRRVWHLLADPRSRHAVEVAERVADGKAFYAEMLAARASARAAVTVPLNEDGGWPNTPETAAARVGYTRLAYLQAVAFALSDREQSDLLREIFGDPFRPAVRDPGWRGDDIAAVMARVIYDERRFDDLPILADALEEAGCDDADVLGHCRGGGEHVRGCWVVDLILGKQ